MSQVGASNGVGYVSQIDIQGMDIETAMMAVQSNRANLLDAQLKDQFAAVQGRNNNIASMNEQMQILVKAKGETASTSATEPLKSASKAILTAAVDKSAELAYKAMNQTLLDKAGAIPRTSVNLGIDSIVKLNEMTEVLNAEKVNINPALGAALDQLATLRRQSKDSCSLGNDTVTSAEQMGITDQIAVVEALGGDARFAKVDTNAQLTAAKTNLPTPKSPFDGIETVGQLESAISDMKSQIDGQSNSQQMDMLRLQTMSNKRNEAFEMMSNFAKKLQDARSSILQKM
jgi:hypothetical protein